jgi:hypothetical protein
VAKGTADVPSTRPLAAKLGIKSGFAVCLLGAPPRFAALLAPLPADVTLSARSLPGADLFIAFVRQARELELRLAELGPLVGRQTLWLAWPKQAAQVATDLNGNIVRETGLAAGWVDFKVCAIDPTWSGLAFKRRRRER